MDEATRRCGSCGVRRPLTDFYISAEHAHQQRWGRRKIKSCRYCARAKMLAVTAEKTAYIQRVKIESGCMDCGLRSDHPEVYDFDHRPGEDKVGDVSNLRAQGSLERLIVEIAKCDIVCANCHRVRTVARRDHQRGFGLDRPPRVMVIVEIPENPQLSFDIDPG